MRGPPPPLEICAPARAVVPVPVPVFSKDERRVLATKRFAVLRRAKGKHSSIEDLRNIVAGSDAPIKKLPAGAHRGWVPTWLE